MARIHGARGAVEMDDTGGATATPVLDLNSWTMDAATDKVDVTAFGDTNKQYVQGLPDIKGTLGGFWSSSTSPRLFAIAFGTVAPFLKLIPSSTEPTFFFAGKAYLDASINVNSSGAVTLTANWVAAGPWTQEPATP